MRKLLSVTFFSGLLTLARMGCGFIIAKVVAIYTGPTGMAMLGQIQSMVGGLNGIVNAPLGSGLVRYTAEFEKNGIEACSPWWKASTWWLLIILGTIMPVGFLFSHPLALWLFHNEDYAWIILVSTAVLPFSALGTLINSVINGYQQYKRYILLGAISTAVSCVFMVILILNWGITGALLAASVQMGIIGVIMLVGVLRQPWFSLCYWWGVTEKEKKKKIGGYILMAVSSALTAPVALIGVRNILISHGGWEQAGQWQAVWKISEVYLGVITISLSTYYLPKLSVLKDINDIRKEINRTLLIVVPIVSVMALCVYFLKDMIISLLFTDEFREARNLFLIQLAGDVIKIASWLYAYPMISRGATKWFVFSEVFFSALFVILSYFLVSHFGTQGVNIAYLINYSLYMTFVFFNLNRICRR
ncbi:MULTISPECIES: O-antigen translocase [Pectobacterium]|uniref:Polysaccharide biosynthesis protein n=1 Tax=Pectobacterium carotovorum subsp. carotovorum (strain PC1) TaxID=561230 RepID=C6DCK2_PECCP|nr:O-antigen translocase [Pectobacterium carotovorum]ACT12352.1 polysaccharide biosynthesis protein [Pectobacterium carotovorum subsp. carotovorum PC1]